ncbi:hypothetical protein BLNAU_15198 [Blattamonas nauphoetae]|uniref:Protein kinase domain-containing protein n=1 Tax=Blattamonas nauphoetae TaxID=2049346 RepID=A0ABQ9XER9_9EUKA|nr:hypothetical protein BLNAU_15198 [Blattamonas nauphoetae]
MLTVVLLAIIPTSHPTINENHAGPSLNHLLVTSPADASLSSSTPNCLHLSTSTWIASTIHLTSKDVTVIGSEQTIITTVSGKQLADNQRIQLDSNSSSNCALSSIFSIQNTTLSLASLTFDLISGPQNQESWHVCSLSWNSHVLAESLIFNVDAAVSPFKLVPSTFSSESSCSLTFSLCMLKNSGNQIGSVLEIDNALPPTESISMSISSFQLDSHTLTSNSGLSFSSSPSEYGLTNDCQIQTVVSDCQFFNLSSNPAHPTSRSFRWLRERIVGCEVRCVVKSLEGTLTTRLGKQSEFSIQNSSLLECVNEEVIETTKSYDSIPEITSSAQRINHGKEFTHYVFRGCTIKATNMTTSFVLIALNPLSGNVEFVGCSFEVECSTVHNTLISASAVRDNKVKCLIDTCTFKFWRETETSTGNNQILLYNFQELSVVSSTFSPPPSKFSSARAISISYPISFLFFSNNSFTQQTSNGSGGALNLPLSIIRFFHCHFEGNKALNGGAISTSSRWHDFCSCTFTRNEAMKAGGAIYSSYLTQLRMFDCHFDQNQASWKYENDQTQLAHYRGNDIFAYSSIWNGMDGTTVFGCTSTSETPKYGYFSSNSNNGVHPQDDILLPSPSGSSFSNVFFVEAGESGMCSEGDPCGSVGAALSELSTDPSLINLGNGIFEEDTLDISKRVELRGLGFFVNTSTFTTLKTSCVVSGGGNVTLMSLSLKPTDSSSTIFAMQSTSQSFLSNVKIECISGHLTPLLSFSSGTSTVHSSWLSSIEMENHAAIEITGSASVTFHAAWFMEIVRVNGNGGSCIDSSTSGVISFIQTNMAHCSSSGRAGCLDLIASSSSSQVIVYSILFTKNTVKSSLSVFGNDIAHTGYVPSKINTISTCRSLSDLPHILVNLSSVTNLVSQSCFFTPNGIDHPFATDFEQGVPLSWFRGFQEEIDAMMESSTDVQLRISGSQTFTPFEVTRKYIQIKSCSLTPQFYDRQLVFVGDAGNLQLTSTAMTFSNAPTVIPIVVAPTAIRLSFQSFSITLSESQQNVPFIQCNGGTLQFNGITFLTPSGLSLTGCSLVECSATTREFLASAIASVTSDEDGAVVHATNCSFKSESSSFKKCRARNGGAVAIELSGSKTILVTHESTSAFATSFSECVAVGDSSGGSNSLGRGGALFVCGTSTHSTPILFNSSSTNHARFEGNIADLGMDLFITSDLFKSKETIAIASFGGGSMSADDHVAIEDRPSSDSEWIGLLIPTPKVSVNGSITEIMTGKSGQDTESCKWTSTFCATLGYGIGHLTKKYASGELFPQSIQFVWNMTYDETGVVVNDQDVSVSGTTATNAKTAEVLRTIVEIVESTTASSLFTIKNHSKLSVSGLDLRAIGKCGLFDLEADGDCLIVSDVGVVCSDGTEYWKALIKSSGRPVSIDSCTFNTSNGGPATLTHPLIQLVPPSADIVPSAAITLCSVRISSFKSKRMIVEIDTDGPISVLNTLFSSCSSSSEMNGKVIHVKTSNLDKSITKERWSGSVVEGVEASWFYGQDRSLASTSGLFELSLLLMLGDGPSDTILVSSTSHCSPHINCGSCALPCSTFEVSLRASSNHSIDSIVIAQSSLLESHFVAESSLTIQSQSGRHDLTLQSTAQFGVDDDSTVLLLSSLEILIAPTCSSSPVILVSKGELHLSSCQIGTDSLALLHSDVTTLIKVLGTGSLRLTDTMIQNLQFTNPEQGTTIFLEMDATFVTDSSSIFSAISSNGTGSLIFVCSDNLSQTATTSPLLDFNSTIPLPTNTLFSETEKNRFFGREGSDEWSLLYFWHPRTSGSVHINSAGQDHPNCGIEQLPCSSLLAAHNKLTEANQTIILASDASLSSTLLARSAGSVISSESSSFVVSLTSSAQFSVEPSTSLTLTNHIMSLPDAITETVFLVSSGSLSLSSLNIRTTAVSPSSAAPLFSVSSGSLTLTNTIILFDHLFQLDSSSVIEQMGGKVEMTGCEIVNVSKVSGDGSVVHSTLASAKDSLSVDGCSFLSCSSSGKGGVIFVSCGSSVPSSNLIVRSTFDNSCSCGSSEKGSRVFVEGHSLSSLITSPNWQTTIASLSTPTHDSLLWGTDNSEQLSSDYRSVSVLAFLAEYNSNSISVGSGGKDVSGCGVENRRCSGLDLAHSHLAGDGVHSFVIHSESSLASTISIGAHDLTISPFDVSASVSVESSGGFVVPRSLLTLAQLVFQSVSTARSLSLITISESGSADISKSSFSSFVLSSSALISHSAGTLKLVSSNFSSISRHEGNGGVLESEMKEGMKLFVDSVLLSSVSVSNGFGDGLFVSFSSISSPSKIPEFTLTNLKYSVSGEMNTVPRFVWIEGNDMSSWIVNNDSRVAGSYGVGVEEEWLWSVDKSEELSTSLVFYLKAGSGPIGISESGRDHPRCGYFSLWCSSMSQAMSRGEEMGASQMNVMGSAEVSIGVDLWNEMRMKGKPVMSRLRMRKTGCFSEVGGDTVHFESLLFEIETDQRTLSPFTVTSGHLNVSNVELKVIGSSEISFFKSLSSQLSLQMVRFSETTSKLGSIVECEGGIVTLTDIQLSSLSFSQTPFIASRFDSVHLKEITTQNISIGQLVSISNGSNFQMVGCSFEGPSQSPPSSSNDDEDENKNDLCAWTTGAVSLADTKANVDGCRFLSLMNAALLLQKSNLTIDACVFRDNTPHNTSFPSARRNLRCVDGEVRIGSLSGGDGFESPSLWMSSENCVVRRNETAVEAAHFIPSLDGSKSSVVTSKNNSMTITLAGSLFIPCSLFLEVSETTSSKLNKTPFVVSLTPSTTLSFSETEINLTLSHSELNKTLNVDSELTGCLVVGDGVRSSSFVLKQSLVDVNKSKGAAMMKWLLPLICGVVGLGLIVVLVIVILICRRRKENVKMSEGLLTNQELHEEEIVKEDILPEHSVGTAGFVFEESDKDQNVMHEETLEQREGKDICDDNMPSAQSFGEEMLVGMNGEIQVLSVPKYVSLFEKLHGNHPSTMAEKQRIVFQLVSALNHLAESQPSHEVLTRLSPHVVLLNEKEEIRFDVHNTMLGREHFGKFTAEEASRRREDEQRWLAPETDEKNEGEVDGPAASVFSLGLLLAEMDTGQVPFGEVDGINAHRMAGTGTRPNMEGMNEDLENLILECLELNPSDRPSLDTILSSLNSISLKAKRPRIAPDDVGQGVDGMCQQLNTDKMKDTANNQLLFLA